MSNEQIPPFAYIEAQILHRAAKEGALVATAQLVERTYGVPSGTFGRGIFFEIRLLSLLYFLVVVPKELWDLDESHPIYDEIAREWALTHVVVFLDNSSWQKPIYRFIHHLRNAVAHANFEFKQQNFEFWDENRSGAVRYRAAVSVTAIERFLEIVGSRLANFGTQKGSIQ
jgi:hypothetical protein